jgi:HEAT repeat protein
VPALVECFEDASVPVRESAILALGTSASEAGVHALLSLLVEPRDVTPRAKALAIVALGVARLHGRGEGTDGMLLGLLERLEDEGGDDIVQAVALHQALAPSPALAARVRCATGRFREDCEHEEAHAGTVERALEGLRFDADVASVLPRLLDALHGRVVEQRRAAASTLAEVPGALGALLTAHELEKEPLARGRLLLSIGEQGGAAAREYLVERLDKGKKTEFAWAALGLGILAGEGDDEEARAALRTAFDGASLKEKESVALALGFARDREAHARLVATLAEGRSDRLRMFASVALGLIGGTQSHAVLLEALASVNCPYARAGMGLALALEAEPGDTARLTRLLADERRPESLRDLALALGLRGTSETAGALVGLLDADPTVAVRAATLDALGLALSDAPELAATRLGRDSNYAAWPAWVRDVVRRAL